MEMTINSVVAEYLDDNARWMDESSAAVIEGLTDQQLEAIIEASEYFCGSEPGIDCALVKTHETLDDFDASRANHWSERGGRDEIELSGFAGRAYERFQLFKGKPRQSMVVIDLGDYRVTLV